MSHNLDLADEVPAQALVEQLGHHDWRMVEQAYRALVRAGQTGAEAITKVLSRPDARVRIRCART